MSRLAWLNIGDDVLCGPNIFSHGAYEIPRIAENYSVEKESAVRCTIIAMARKGRPSTMGEDAPIGIELNSCPESRASTLTPLFYKLHNA